MEHLTLVTQIDALPDTAGVTIGVMECLLHQTIDGDLDRQRRLVRRPVQIKCDRCAAALFVDAHRATNRVREGQPVELRYAQTGRHRPYLNHRPLQRVPDNYEISHDVTIGLALRRDGFIDDGVIQPQEGQPQFLHRPIVKLRADASQDALVERSSTCRCPPNAVMQSFVLRQQFRKSGHLFAECDLLPIDGVPRAADKARQQGVDYQHG